jgi:hypothetical protein
MDPDVRKLVILLMLQLSLLTTLECMSTVDRSILVAHWHQMWCMTLALRGLRGSELGGSRAGKRARREGDEGDDQLSDARWPSPGLDHICPGQSSGSF